MKITIARLETYPAEEPTGYAVGFSVSLPNGTSFYRDVVVGFNDALTDEAAVGKAVEQLKTQLAEEAERLDKKSSLLGTSLKEADLAVVTAERAKIRDRKPDEPIDPIIKEV